MKMTKMMMKTKITHKFLGDCYLTEESEFMQSTNPDPSSYFVEHDDEIKEVSKHLLKFS